MVLPIPVRKYRHCLFPLLEPRSKTGFLEPFVEAGDPIRDANARTPPGSVAKFASVGDVVLLVCGTPVIKLHIGLLAMQLCDDSQQFQQADGVLGTAPHVERISRQPLYL